jgi:hypothetical protein
MKLVNAAIFVHYPLPVSDYFTAATLLETRSDTSQFRAYKLETSPMPSSSMPDPKKKSNWAYMYHHGNRFAAPHMAM